ncbi:MAG: hypothetical protein JZU53_13380 [Paludibacter sp.]|nr:hypothetical protein [Paludibacter sp.]
MKIVNWFKKRSALELLSLSVLAISIIMIIAFILNFWGTLSDYVEDWGSFGSYFGSVAGLLAFLGALLTVIQSNKATLEAKKDAARAEIKANIAADIAATDAQRREDIATKQAIKREERDLFFKLLELHKNKLETVVYTGNNFEVNYKGINAIDNYIIILNNILLEYSFNYCIISMSTECFNKLDPTKYIELEILMRSNAINTELTNNYQNTPNPQNINLAGVQEYIKKKINTFFLYSKINYDQSFANPYSNIFEYFNIYINSETMFNAMQVAGNILYVKFGHLLGQYFRNMYYMLETINRFNYDKIYYFELYRAQLSRKESLICLFNTVSSKSNIENLELIATSKIFDDIFCKDLFLIRFDDSWIEQEKKFIDSILFCFTEAEKNLDKKS